MRYYYTDPLAAAWMCRHFAMGFSTERFYFLADYGNPDRFPGLFCDERGTLPPYDKIYIHPDSLHLLEPKVGDVIEFFDRGKQVVQVTKEDEDCAVYEQGLPIDFVLDHKEKIAIIQRDGKAFMWPEVE